MLYEKITVGKIALIYKHPRIEVYTGNDVSYNQCGGYIVVTSKDKPFDW